MISLKDLKEQILADKINHFYVFYGEDCGLRQHYIDRISKKYKQVKSVDNVYDLANKIGDANGLFKTSRLFIVYNDVEFAKSKVADINRLIKKLKDDCVIVTYDQELPTSTLFKSFTDYITYFPTVEDKIAQEFVDSEISISLDSKIELCKNCNNNYSNILLETDKIKNYAQAKNVSEQIAFDELTQQNQLLFEYPKYKPDDLMDDIFLGKFENLAYWDKLLNIVYKDQFWIMFSGIFNNYLIAYLIKKFGKYEGSTLAYNYGLPWYRTKQIREYNFHKICTASYLIDCAYEVSKLDQKVKSGQIAQEDLFNIFITTIL